MSLFTSLRTSLRSSLTTRSLSLSSSVASTSTLPAAATQVVSSYSLPKGNTLTGIVISTGKMAHTTKVSVERKAVDHKTLKVFRKNRNYLIHDPNSVCVVGDKVLIRNCVPVSKLKRFELVQVLQGARERAENMKEAALKEVENQEEANAAV